VGVGAGGGVDCGTVDGGAIGEVLGVGVGVGVGFGVGDATTATAAGVEGDVVASRRTVGGALLGKTGADPQPTTRAATTQNTAPTNTGNRISRSLCFHAPFREYDADGIECV
jgi:hypothetical protein